MVVLHDGLANRNVRVLEHEKNIRAILVGGGFTKADRLLDDEIIVVFLDEILE